jgi:hypothetical protein
MERKIIFNPYFLRNKFELLPCRRRDDQNQGRHQHPEGLPRPLCWWRRHAAPQGATPPAERAAALATSPSSRVARCRGGGMKAPLCTYLLPT